MSGFAYHTGLFTLTLTLAGALGLSGCGSTEDDGTGLQQDDVTNIPEGDATGDAATGLYTITLRTTACEGQCSATVLGFPASVCDVGELQMETVMITQQEGSLESEWADPVSLLRGGIDTDGRFDIGGYATQFGGEFEISMRATGQIDGADLTGEARSWSVGPVEEEDVDCYGEYEIEGLRIGGGDGKGDGDGIACDSDEDCAGAGVLRNDLWG